MPTITVHHLENSRSHRVLWLLEELGLDYDIVEYARDPRTMRAPPELRQLHPLGKAPVVTIDDVVLAESGAIIEHFVELAGQLAPPSGTPEHRRYRYWLHYAEGSLMSPLLVRLIFDQISNAKLPFFVKPIAKGIVDKVESNFTRPELQNHFAFIEAELDGRPYFAGDDFSAADIQMSYAVQAGVARARLGDLPNASAWLARIQQRPAYQRAEQRGGANEIPGA